MFKNRSEAGQMLAEKLTSYKGKDAIVLALPRGGVVLGHEIVRLLFLPLDIIVVRKIGHPFNLEYAMGVIDEHGAIILDETKTATVDKTWLEKEINKQQEEAKRRSSVYRKGKKPLNLKDKIVILVDDGIATGFSMQLAVRSVKEQQVDRIVVAVPVASAEAIHTLKKEGADECLTLLPPEEFMGAVGAHYAQFPQIEDDEVIRLLN